MWSFKSVGLLAQVNYSENTLLGARKGGLLDAWF